MISKKEVYLNGRTSTNKMQIRNCIREYLQDLVNYRKTFSNLIFTIEYSNNQKTPTDTNKTFPS